MREEEGKVKKKLEGQAKRIMQHSDAERFCPIFRYDSEAKTFPVTIEDLLESCQVRDGDDKLVQATYPLREPSRLYIDDITYFRKPRGHAIYYRMYEYAPGVTAFLYILVYRYNQGYKTVAGKIGDHSGDVEHVTVLVRDGEPFRMYFAAHSHTQGQWVEWNDVEKQNARAVVYIARESNAAYTRAGTWVRLGCFANDHCDGQGVEVSPGVNAEVRHATGNWVDSQIGEVQAPAEQDWFTKENGESVTWWRRFFGCFKDQNK